MAVNDQSLKELQDELEIKTQALYDCERQKRTAEALILECQEELRILQNQNSQENKKLEEKIHQLEEENVSLRSSYNQQISSFEKELQNKDQEILDLKQELNDIIKISKTQTVPEDNLLSEISNLKEQNCLLSDQIEELVRSCEEKCKGITDLDKINMQLKEELDSHKEIIKCKKNEIDEANYLIQTLKDDYCCIKSELDSLRSKPLDDKSRGNSLFAEVDDRRVQLQENVNTMKAKYLEMKRERMSYLKQITLLRNENATLLARWEAEVSEKADDDEMILQSYKNHIKILTEIVEDYKKQQAEENSISNNDSSLKFFDKMLASKNNEIEILKQKLVSNSLNETLLSHDLASARREIRTYKLEILKLQNYNGQLNSEIEEIKMKSPTEQVCVEEQIEKVSIKSIVKKDVETNQETDIIDLSESLNEIKENCAINNRKVQFTENTIEPNVTERAKYKKGAKVLYSKPIHISSASKNVE